MSMTEEQLQLRRELEPIIKRFRNCHITMRGAMTELEVVFESRLAEANKRVEERDKTIKLLQDRLYALKIENEVLTNDKKGK